ncbi:unnamed protein product, partial [Allacma fusca]
MTFSYNSRGIQINLLKIFREPAGLAE